MKPSRPQQASRRVPAVIHSEDGQTAALSGRWLFLPAGCEEGSKCEENMSKRVEKSHKKRREMDRGKVAPHLQAALG